MTEYDPIIRTIAEYVMRPALASDEAFHTAKGCLADALGCATLALKYPGCTKLLGPVIPGTVVPGGCPIPGTPYHLDPILAAFNIGILIRWLDFNDTWLAAEWGHPSDNLGGLLAVGDYLNRIQRKKFTLTHLLEAMIKAYEVQGILALGNSFNRVGFDHVILVNVATAAVTTAMLGGTVEQVMNAISNAWIDVGPLRAYRHQPNTGSRKSWASGDASSRGVWHAFMALKGEMGYSTVLTAHKWGLQDVLFDGKALTLDMPLESYVMENILFKISYPAEFHAQTALEAAIQLHPTLLGRFDEIDKIEIETQEPAVRIIDKKGNLNNPADRDHCLQYIIAIGLLYGTLNADHYEDKIAENPAIDQLRSKMEVRENPEYSKGYYDSKKRSIANAITVIFKDGTRTRRVEVEYPIGHKRRRTEGTHLLYQKFYNNMDAHYPDDIVESLRTLWEHPQTFDDTTVSQFLDLLTISERLDG